MSYIWLSFCSGTCYCHEFSATSNFHAARQNLPRLVALRIAKSFRNMVIIAESEKTIANRFQTATKRGKFSRAAWELFLCQTRDNRKSQSIFNLKIDTPGVSLGAVARGFALAPLKTVSFRPQTKLQSRGGGGGTAIYGLYRYVPL